MARRLDNRRENRTFFLAVAYFQYNVWRSCTRRRFSLFSFFSFSLSKPFPIRQDANSWPPEKATRLRHPAEEEITTEPEVAAVGVAVEAAVEGMEPVVEDVEGLAGAVVVVVVAQLLPRLRP